MTATAMLPINKYILFCMLCWPASSQAVDVSRRQLLAGLGTAALTATTPKIPVISKPLSPQIKEALIQSRAAFYMGQRHAGFNNHIGSIFAFFDSSSPRFNSTIDYLEKWFGGQFKFFETHPGQWNVLLHKINSGDSMDMARVEVALAEHFNIPIEHVAEEVECIRYPSHDERAWYGSAQFRKFKAMGPEFQDVYLQLLEIPFPVHAQKLRKTILRNRFSSIYDYAFRRWDVEQKLQEHFKIPMEHVLQEVERIQTSPGMYGLKTPQFPKMGKDFDEMYIKILSIYVPEYSQKIQKNLELSEKYQEAQAQEQRKVAEYRAQRILKLASATNTALNVVNGVSEVLAQQHQAEQVVEEGTDCQPKLLPAPTEQSIQMEIISLEPENLEVVK